MISANDTQVAGTHYRNTYQHWDFAADCGLGYFEGQITKYITRHRSKKGLEDLEKALHFTAKLIELANKSRLPFSGGVTAETMLSFADANKLNFDERRCIYQAVMWGYVEDLHRLRTNIHVMVAHYYSSNDDGAEPTSAYTNQG